MLNLDTNVVAALLNGSLRKDEVRAMDDDPHWAISAIVLWEVAMLHRAGRIGFGVDDPAFRSLLGQVDVLPLSLEVARQSQRLDFSSDPADEIIAATSIVFGAPLVTRDSTLLASRIVPFALA